MKAGFHREQVNISFPCLHIWGIPEDISTESALDPLSLAVTVWESGNAGGAVVSIDCLALPYALTKKFRDKLILKGFMADMVSVSATHAHAVPVPENIYSVPEQFRAFTDALERSFDIAVDLALQDMAQVSLFRAGGSCDIGLNRRQIGRRDQVNDINAPSGDVDSEISLLVFSRKDGKDILWVNYTAHPVSMLSPHMLSADYPGRVYKNLEKENFRVQFFQGAAGNVNVKIHSVDGSATEKLGNILSECILKSLADPVPLEPVPARGAVIDIALPWDKAGTMEFLREISVPNTNVAYRKFAFDWISTIEQRLSATDQMTASELQLLQFGDFKIVFLPGEPFMEYALEIKKMGASMLVGYSNHGEVGYLPTASAFTDPGYQYETKDSCYVYNHPKYAASIESELLEKSSLLLTGLRQ